MMPVFRVNKTNDYTVMANYHFRNNEMSLKAKGLLSQMLALPDDWNYSVEGLVALAKDGREGISKALKELEQFGYLERVFIRDKGKINCIYNIYEKPQRENRDGKTVTAKPQRENRDGKTVTAKPQQLNTNILNTNILNTKELNTKELNTKEDLYIKGTAAYFEDEAIQEAFENFIADRKERKKPMTKRAIDIAVKKINELSEGKPEKAVAIINQSIEKGWNGIFPLQESQARRAPQAKQAQSFKDIDLSTINLDEFETGFAELEEKGDRNIDYPRNQNTINSNI